MNSEKNEAGKKRKPKVGVVVGSGGIKALSAVALFEFIEESKIDVDLAIGCSGGSLVVGSWACGTDIVTMRKQAQTLWGKGLLSKIDYRTLLSIAGLPFGRFDKTCGLIKPHVAHQTHIDMYGDVLIEDLRTKTLFQTTDVLSGKPVMLNSGLLRDAVYASGALFPLLPPLSIDGRLLMDGAYSSPLPIMEAVNQGMDVVIAITYEERTTAESRGFVPYFMRNMGYCQYWMQRSQVALSVDMHHHEIVFVNVVFDKFISLRSSKRVPEILDSGRKAVESKKDEILEAIKNFSSSKQD